MTTLLIPLVPAGAVADAPAAQRPLNGAAPGGPVLQPDCSGLLEGSGLLDSSADGLAVRAPALSGWLQAVREAYDPALLIEPDGAVVASSRAGADLLGRTVGELVGRPLADAADFVDFRRSARPLDRDAARLVPLRVLRSGASGRGLVRFRRHEETVTCDVVASALHDTAGALVGALVLLAPVPA